MGANLTEEAARAVLKRRKFFVTSLRSLWSTFRAEVLSCRFLFASESLDEDDALGDSAPFVLQAMLAVWGEKDREQALSQSFWLFYDPMRTAVLSRGIPTQRDWEMMGWVMKSKKRVTVSYLMSGCGRF